VTNENKKHIKPELPSLSDELSTVQQDEEQQKTIKLFDVEFTAEECLDDIQVLSREFPDRRITRDFYRKNANIPESVWTGFFGTFPEFLRLAGLEHTRYANKIRLKAAQHASMDKLREISEERKTYGNLYNRDRSGRWKTMIACSDLHDRECDPFYLRVLIETIKMVSPDAVCLNGDIFDLPEFGKHPKDPRDWDTVGRLEFGLDIIRQIREAAPEAQIDLIEGNHEARVIKHLMDCSPAIRHVLADFHGFSIQKLFKLDEYEVNYVADADLHAFTDAQLQKEMVKNYRMYWGCLLAHHFPFGRQKGVPGFNGHHHKHIVWSEHNARMGSYEWHQLGAGHKREAVYCDATKWNNGFIIANVDTHTESVVFDYTDVGSTFSIAGGTWYYRQPNEFYPALEKELEFRKNGG